MQKNDLFYMACLRDTVGSNVAFHGLDGNGYHTNVSKAQVFTKAQAQRFWDNGREFDLPLKADLVDALTKFHVDCQYIPTQTTLKDGCTRYVGFLKGRWDGNDVYWLTEITRNRDSFETDFSKALVVRKPIASEQITWIPFEIADKVKRKTFSISLLNKRTMTQGAGLVTPSHIKRANRRKPSSGKTRWNCPGCGKISWQHNPYDFEGCARCA